MKAHPLAGLICAAVTPFWVPLIAAPLSASAEPCPDVEVVFARGTSAPPGVGRVGQSFVDTLRAHVGARSVGMYPVNYPATTDFPTAVDGISDAGAHLLQAADFVAGRLSVGA